MPTIKSTTVQALRIPFDNSTPHLITLRTSTTTNNSTTLDLIPYFLHHAKSPTFLVSIELSLKNATSRDLSGTYRIYFTTDPTLLIPRNEFRWDLINDYEKVIYGDMIVVKRDEKAFVTASGGGVGEVGVTNAVVDVPGSLVTLLLYRNLRFGLDFERVDDANRWVAEGCRRVPYQIGFLTLENWYRS